MNAIIVVIGLLVLLYLAFIYTSESLAMLFFFLLIYAIVAEFALIICHRWVSCRLRIPIGTVDAGGSVGVEVQTVSPSAWTGPRLKFVFTVRNTFTGNTIRIRRKVGKSIGKEISYPFVLALPEAGNYEVTLRSVRFYDRMGLLSFKMKLKGQTQTVQVLPKLREVPVRISQPVRRFYGESDVYDEEREGQDSSQLFDVRPFTQGDKLQKIHWKLSARTDAWMVRMDSMPKACAVVVLLDYCAVTEKRRRRAMYAQQEDGTDSRKKSGRRRRRKEAREQQEDGTGSRKKSGRRRRRKAARVRESGSFLEMAGSISYSLMDADCPHYMVWYDEKNRDVARIRVDDEESFYRFLTQYLLSGQETPPPQELEVMYQERYRSEHYLYSLRLTQGMEIYKNEERIFQPEDGDWDQVEILL